MTQLPLSIFIIPLVVLLILVAIPLLCMRNKKPWSVWSYLRYGRQQAKARIGGHRLPLLFVFVFLFVLGFVQWSFGSYPTSQLDAFGNSEMALNSIGRVIQVIISIFGVWYTVGMIKLGLCGVDEKPYSFATMFDHTWSEIWKYLVTVILFTLMLFVPLVLLGGLVYLVYQMNPSVGVVIAIIAGVAGLLYILHVVFRISLILYYVVVDHVDVMSPVEMIKHAWYMSKGHVWKLFIVGFVAGLTNVLGVLALGVWLLWTIPLSQIAVAKLYREIDDSYHDKKNNALEA